MRFRSEYLADIRRGEKTQIRKARRKDWEHPPNLRIGGYYEIEKLTTKRTVYPCPWNGEDCVICEEGREHSTDDPVSVATGEYVQVLGIHRGTLGDLTDDDALQEGFESREEALEHYKNTYGMGARRKVWAITFTYTIDVPRILVARPHSRDKQTVPNLDADLGYSHSLEGALDRDAPDGPSAEWLQRRSQKAREDFANLKRAEVEEHLNAAESDAERLTILKAAAEGAGVDFRDQLRVLERRILDNIERARRAA